MQDSRLARLFARFREEHDGRALAGVFDATAGELLSVAAHLVGGREAEDLVQTTFLRMIERAPHWDPERGLKGWMYGILWREAARVRREAARRPAGALPEDLPARPAREPDELAPVLRAALTRVASPYREVLEPVLLEELGTSAVAARLGRAPGTVRVQLQRGLERLRSELGPARRRANAPASLAAVAALRTRVLGAAGFPEGSVAAASSWSALAPALPLGLGSVALVGLAALGVETWRARSADARHAEQRAALAALGEPSPTARTVEAGGGVAGTSAEREPVAVPESAALEAAAPTAATAVLRARRPPDAAFDRPIAVWASPLVPGQSGGQEKERLEAEGTAEFALAPGRWRLWTLNQAGPNYLPLELELAAGEVREVVLTPGAGVLAGRLLCGGELLADAALAGVWCRETGREGGQFARGAVGPDGSYLVEGLDERAAGYELFVDAPGALRWSQELVLAGRDTRLDVDLPAGRVEGRLTGVAPSGESPSEIRLFPRGWMPESGSRGAFVAPDAEGRFAFRHLAPGEYELSAVRVAEPVPARLATITADSPVAEVELAPAAETGTLVGRLAGCEPWGEREPALALLAREPAGLRRVGYARLERDGSFRAEALEPGRYALLVSDFRSDVGPRLPFALLPEVEVRAHALERVEFALPPARTVVVHLDSGGAWTRRSTWRLRVGTGDWLSYILFIGSESEGRRAGAAPFALPLGDYALEADFGDARPVLQPFRVEPGSGVQEVVVHRP